MCVRVAEDKRHFSFFSTLPFFFHPQKRDDEKKNFLELLERRRRVGPRGSAQERRREEEGTEKEVYILERGYARKSGTPLQARRRLTSRHVDVRVSSAATSRDPTHHIKHSSFFHENPKSIDAIGLF